MVEAGSQFTADNFAVLFASRITARKDKVYVPKTGALPGQRRAAVLMLRTCTSSVQAFQYQQKTLEVPC